MRGDLVLFHAKEFGIDQFSVVMNGLAGRIMTPRHPANGRFTMLSSRPGFEGDRVDTSAEEIIQEIGVTGYATFQYWLQDTPESDVVITFSKEELGCETRVHFDGLEPFEAYAVARESIALSLRPDLIATSLGAVVDWPMDDALESWEDFFFRQSGPPGYVPPFLWHKKVPGRGGHQQGLHFQMTDPHWIFPELVGNAPE